MLLQYPQRDVHKDFNYTVPVGQKHIEKSAFPEQHSAVLAAENVRACIFRGVLQTSLPPPITMTLCDTGSSFPDVQGGRFQGHTLSFFLSFP